MSVARVLDYSVAYKNCTAGEKGMKAALQGVYWEGMGTLILRGLLILVVLCYRRVTHSPWVLRVAPGCPHGCSAHAFRKLPRLTGRQVPEGAQGAPAARMHVRYGQATT